MPTERLMMRHLEWKKLQGHPVVVKAREALRMAQEELSEDPAWKEQVTHLSIFPDSMQKNVLYLLVTDFAYVTFGQPPLFKRKISWEEMAIVSSEEAKAMIIAEIKQLKLPQHSETRKEVV